ncbi:hypothetical protein COBT_000578 [Conglomerata obtusa]
MSIMTKKYAFMVILKRVVIKENVSHLSNKNIISVTTYTYNKLGNVPIIMGRKKARRTSIRRTRKIMPLPTRFSCPECNHENVVVCKINKIEKRAVAHCSVCEASHSCKANHLSAPIDIYTDWIDNYTVSKK